MMYINIKYFVIWKKPKVQGGYKQKIKILNICNIFNLMQITCLPKVSMLLSY